MERMSEQAKAAARAYKKRWRAANKDKVRASNIKYWEQVAAREQEAHDEQNEGD